MSDHYPCLTLFPDLGNVVKLEKIVYKQTMKEKEINRIKESLDQENWEAMLLAWSCNESFEYFHKILTEIIDRVSQEKRVVIKASKKKHDPWITGGILKSISKQKRLYLEAIHSDVGSGKTEGYKQYRATLQRIIRKNKQKYLHAKCVEYGTDVKKMW